MSRLRASASFLGLIPALLLATQHQARAQSNGRAFDTLSVGVRAVANVNRNTFHEFWSPDPGVELNIETPFYLGLVEAGVQYSRFSAREPEQPDFNSWFPFLGWGVDWHLPIGLEWYNGVRIGSFWMVFDIPTGGNNEQELGLGLNSRLGYAFARRWFIDLSGRYRVAFTHERIHHLFVALGIRRSFRTPRWLKDVLD